MVSSAIFRSSSASSSLPTCPSCSIMPSAYSVRAVSPGLSRCSFLTWVRKCILVVFIQQKNGLPVLVCRLLSLTAVSGLKPNRGGGDPDLAQPGPQRAFTGNEARPPGGAALLGVVVGEDHAFPGDPVDVRRAVAHQAVGVGADVRLTDVVAEDDQDV